MKRFTAVLIAVLMILSILPGAFAVSGSDDGDDERREFEYEDEYYTYKYVYENGEYRLLKKVKKEGSRKPLPVQPVGVAVDPYYGNIEPGPGYYDPKPTQSYPVEPYATGTAVAVQGYQVEEVCNALTDGQAQTFRFSQNGATFTVVARIFDGNKGILIIEGDGFRREVEIQPERSTHELVLADGITGLIVNAAVSSNERIAKACLQLHGKPYKVAYEKKDIPSYDVEKIFIQGVKSYQDQFGQTVISVAVTEVFQDGSMQPAKDVNVNIELYLPDGTQIAQPIHMNAYGVYDVVFSPNIQPGMGKLLVQVLKGEQFLDQWEGEVTIFGGRPIPPVPPTPQPQVCVQSCEKQLQYCLESVNQVPGDLDYDERFPAIADVWTEKNGNAYTFWVKAVGSSGGPADQSSTKVYFIVESNGGRWELPAYFDGSSAYYKSEGIPAEKLLNGRSDSKVAVIGVVCSSSSCRRMAVYYVFAAGDGEGRPTEIGREVSTEPAVVQPLERRDDRLCKEQYEACTTKCRGYPVYLPAPSYVPPTVEPVKPQGFAGFGCRVNGYTLAVGTRFEGQYVDLDCSVKKQREAGSAAENNFECKDNLVLEGKCVNVKEERKFWSNLMQLLRKMFWFTGREE